MVMEKWYLPLEKLMKEGGKVVDSNPLKIILGMMNGHGVRKLPNGV